MIDKANAHAFSTSGWETYQSQHLAFSFEHPAGLLFRETQDGVDIYADTAENRAYLKDPAKYESNRPGMFIVTIDQSKNLEQLAKQTFPNQKYVAANLFGEKAIVLTGQGMDRWDVILFMHAETLYEVTIQYGSSDEQQRYYAILSSFSFK